MGKCWNRKSNLFDKMMFMHAQEEKMHCLTYFLVQAFTHYSSYENIVSTRQLLLCSDLIATGWIPEPFCILQMAWKRGRINSNKRISFITDVIHALIKISSLRWTSGGVLTTLPLLLLRLITSTLPPTIKNTRKNHWMMRFPFENRFYKVIL